jgi:hypothetical protein
MSEWTPTHFGIGTQQNAFMQNIFSDVAHNRCAATRCDGVKRRETQCHLPYEGISSAGVSSNVPTPRTVTRAIRKSVFFCWKRVFFCCSVKRKKTIAGTHAPQRAVSARLTIRLSDKWLRHIVRVRFVEAQRRIMASPRTCGAPRACTHTAEILRSVKARERLFRFWLCCVYYGTQAPVWVGGFRIQDSALARIPRDSGFRAYFARDSTAEWIKFGLLKAPAEKTRAISGDFGRSWALFAVSGRVLG